MHMKNFIASSGIEPETGSRESEEALRTSPPRQLKVTAPHALHK